MSEEYLHIQCNKCGKEYRVKIPDTTKRYRCKECQSAMTVEPPKIQEKKYIYKFIDDSGKEVEIYNHDELQECISEGQIILDTLVYANATWKKAEEVEEIKNLFEQEDTIPEVTENHTTADTLDENKEYTFPETDPEENIPVRWLNFYTYVRIPLSECVTWSYLNNYSNEY